MRQPTRPNMYLAVYEIESDLQRLADDRLEAQTSGPVYAFAALGNSRIDRFLRADRRCTPSVI